MSGKRTVRCQDCGHEWESSASSPRCSKADCGRSRNVEPVDGDGDRDDDGDDLEQDADRDRDLDEPEDEPEPVDGDRDDDGDDSSGYEPRFKTRANRVDDGPIETTAPALEDEPGDDDRDDEADDQEASDEDEPEDEIPELEPEDLEPMMHVVFDMAATRRGDHWAIEDTEAERLAAAWTPVANKYAPHIMREHYAITVAGIASIAILKPRIEKDREIAERQEAAERDTAATTEPAESTAIEFQEQDEQTDEQPAEGGYAAV